MRLLEVKVFAITLFTYPTLVRSQNIQRLEQSLVGHHLHNCCNILKQRYFYGERGARL